MFAGKLASVFAGGLAGGGIGEVGGEGGAERGGVAGGHEAASAAVEEGFVHPHGFVGDGRETVGLSLNEEVGQGFPGGSMHGEIGGVVERGGIGGPTEEAHAVVETESGGAGLAGGEGGTVAGEPELDGGRGGELSEDVEEGDLVFLRPEHGDVEEHEGVGGGAVLGAEGVAHGVVGRLGLEHQGVVQDRDALCGHILFGDDFGAGGVAVGDDVARLVEGAAEEEGQGFAGAQGGDDGGVGQAALEGGTVGVGHATHAKHHVGSEGAGAADEARGPPIEAGVAALEGRELQIRRWGLRAQGAARPEGDQVGIVTGLGETAGEEDRLPLGAAAAQVVLHDKYFHCRNRDAETKVSAAMNQSMIQLLLRWSVLALGVTIATKVVPGIECNELSTLIIVVVLLSFLNAVLKPLLMLFALPFIVLTMGVGIVLINATLFWLVSELVNGFSVASFGSALMGAIIVSVTNLLIGGLFGPAKSGRDGKSGGSGGSRGGRGKGGDDDVIDV